MDVFLVAVEGLPANRRHPQPRQAVPSDQAELGGVRHSFLNPNLLNLALGDHPRSHAAPPSHRV
ncbi:hypothetical protein LZ32DRAFT_611807 [Colletotrichum eremochloae]|nr:hypothetical protein LZ32DRAFT_611807 [Colletotrichum eremochloae]